MSVANPCVSTSDFSVDHDPELLGISAEQPLEIDTTQEVSQDGLRFEITLVDGNGGTAASAMSSQTYSAYNPTQNYRGWEMNAAESWRTFYGLETHRLGIDDLNMDLTQYKLRVKILDNASIPQMWMAGGALEFSGNYNSNVQAWEFPLSDFADYIHHPDSTGGKAINPAVRQFTLQPYDVGTQLNYHGHRSVVVTFGLKDGYGVESSGNWQTVDASHLKAAYRKENVQVGDASYDVIVGGFADWLLTTWEQGKDINLRIDTEVDSVSHLISQSLVYRKSSTQDNWQTATLNMPHKISVTGTGYIDGYSRLMGTKDLSENDEFNQFCSALLELQSSYTSKTPGDWAINVSGISFKYPPKRFEGSVTLNTRPSVNWSGNSYMNKLTAAITNRLQGQTLNVGPVHAYDNQLIGGWIDASDGFETLAPDSVFERNVFHVNDDAIKVRTRSLTFKDTVVLQGNAGSAIDLSGYGWTWGAVYGGGIYDTYVHRITQASPPDDHIGGMISNRTIFTPMVSDSSGKGIWDVTISNITVPSFSNGTYDANVVVDTGIFSALNNAPRDFKPNQTSYLNIHDGDHYALETIHISGVKIYPNAKPKSPMYAFGSFVEGSTPDISYQAFVQSQQQQQTVNYDFYDTPKNIMVDWGSGNSYGTVTLGLGVNSLLITGAMGNDNLNAPSDWMTRVNQRPLVRSTSPSENVAYAVCEWKEPAVFYVGQQGRDTYHVEPGMFTAILDQGKASDKDIVTGLPGRARQWSRIRLGRYDYLLVSKRHPETRVLLVDPLGKQNADNRIASLKFDQGKAVGLRRFLRRSSRLISMTYPQAMRKMSLDVESILGLAETDRPFLSGHAGIAPKQVRFLLGRLRQGASQSARSHSSFGGPNQICGDAAPNVLEGSTHVDHIFGLDADDSLFGAADDDWLLGNRGDDSLEGGKGNDYLSGGSGTDQLVGGEGRDVFLLEAEQSHDTIWDFVLGEDTILLGSTVLDFELLDLDGDAHLLSGEEEFAVVRGMGGKLTQTGSLLR